MIAAAGAAAAGPALLASPAAAASERRALVIGNAAYPGAAALANPVRDAEAVGRRLADAGFDVTLGANLDTRRQNRTVSDFLSATRDVELAVFYYAGHGIQLSETNFIMAVDFDPEGLDFTRSLDHFRDHGLISLSAIAEVLSASAANAVLYLDACRTFPLRRSVARRLRGQAGRAVSVAPPGGDGPGARAAPGALVLDGGEIQPGLARFSQGVGVYVAFATAPGAVASDGAGANSPFTAALAAHLATPGLSVEQIDTRVRADVIAATGGAQVPWSQSSLRSTVVITPARRRRPTLVIP